MIFKPHYKIISLVALVIIGSAIFLGLQLPRKTPEINKIYVQEFNNFPLNSEVSIIYNEKEFEDLRISQEREEINYNPQHQKIYYTIKNEDRNTVNIELYKTNKIEASISGLDQNTKIQWRVNNRAITKPIPVDWAGRLSLEIAAPKLNGTFCLALINKQTSKICHLTKNEVAS